VVHGGAVRRRAAPAPVAELVRENTKGRMSIGRAAAALVPEQSVAFLDSGPTTKSIAHALVSRSGLTICTNSLCCALILAQQPGHRVFMLGGEVLRGVSATFGVETIGMIGNIRADIAFIEVAGFAEDGGATDDSFNGADLRGRMIVASRSYIVADARVVGHRAPFRIPHYDKVCRHHRRGGTQYRACRRLGQSRHQGDRGALDLRHVH
jgi:DeoR family glycerol-3-phosphate regulon repressor